VEASNDRTLRLWDLETGKEIAHFTGESDMDSCAIASDGGTIVAGESSGRVHFLRLVEADKTKLLPGEIKIPLLLRKEQAARPARDS
jgi:WD40 repeat protein